MTLGATDFLCVATVDFRGTALRAIAFAFLTTRCFGVAFFLTAFLTAIFLVALLFEETFALAIFRVAVLCATALFAFGRAVFGGVARLFAADLGADRRWVAARDAERLRLLVTALISA